MSRGRGVGLFKSVEYLVPRGRRNPDTGIANFEMQDNFAAGVRFYFDAHVNVPFGSEFDRITNQVDQYLAKPARVAAEHVVNIA